MRNTKGILGLVLLTAMLGCNKSELDLQSRTAISTENFWITEDDVQYGINGIYSELQTGVLYGGSWNSPCSLTHYDSFSDNAWNRIRFEGPGFYIRGTLNSSDNIFRNLWGACYSGEYRSC